eukprot:Nk52_evm13s2415 gene=Nk52_evmTU13s2415
MSALALALLLIYLCATGAHAGPITSVDKPGVAASLQSKDGPYRSVNASLDQSWDMVMFLPAALANQNFASLQADPSRPVFTALKQNFTDITPYYRVGDGSWMYVDLSFSAISIDSSGTTSFGIDVFSIHMEITHGTVSLCDYINGECLNGAEGGKLPFTVDVSGTRMVSNATMAHSDFDVNGSRVSLNTSDVSWHIEGGQYPPPLVDSLEGVISQSFLSQTNLASYPLVSYWKNVTGVDSELIPTAFKVKKFTPRSTGELTFGIYMMTQNRPIPSIPHTGTSNTYADESMYYQTSNPSGDGQVVLLVSNDLLVRRILVNKLESVSGMSVTSEQKTSPAKRKYYNVKATYDSKHTLHYCKSSKMHTTFGGVYCSVDHCVTDPIKFDGINFSSFSKSPSQTMSFSQFYKKFEARGYASAGPSCVPDKKDVVYRYENSINFQISGSKITTTSSFKDKASIPKVKDSIFSYNSIDFKKDLKDAKNIESKVKSASNIGNFVGTFNIWKDQAVMFGEATGLELTYVGVGYDMVLIGKVLH